MLECNEGQADTQTEVANILCLKNVPPLTCYNLDIHDLIVIIFGTSVTEKLRNRTMLCFPTSPIYWFCTTLRNRKPKIASFHLNTVCCFPNEHTKHIQIITWSLLNYLSGFIPKVIDCMHQTTKTYLEREHSILLSVTHTLYVYQVCMSRCPSLCERWELFFVKPGVKVNGQY